MTNKKIQSLGKIKLKLKKVSPLSPAQKTFFKNHKSGKSQALIGSAGTGKTFLSLYKAFWDMKQHPEEFRQVVIVRSAVAVRDIGHLPGTLEEKQEIYESPYKAICAELFDDAEAYDKLVESGAVKFLLTSYIRGLTLDNTIVVVDEFQNMSSHEADSIITRLGQYSKIYFCGDMFQSDFTKVGEKKDISKFIAVIKAMDDYFDFNEFGVEDIVRGELVKAYIMAKNLTYRDGY